MKKTHWMILAVIIMITTNVFLVSSLYNKNTHSSEKDPNIKTANGNTTAIDEKHPLDYLTLRNGNYILMDYKSISIMNVRIDEISAFKSDNDIKLDAKITNDSTSKITWLLLNIYFYNSTGHQIDFIAYPVLNAKEGDKPLDQGDSIKINHLFEQGFIMMDSSNEWDGRFTVEVLSK